MGYKRQTIILGVDPGLANTGYGLILEQGGKLLPLDFGSICTSKELGFSSRLEIIYHELNQIIKKYKPQVMAVEELFFCKNVKTALKVGQAKGVVILAGVNNQLPVVEFTPLQIKQAVSGFGKADKKQVQQMVKLILGLPIIPKPDHAADALAVAICANNSNQCLITSQ